MADLITGAGSAAGSGGEEPPKIEFPCDYPVKVLGRNVTEFRPLVLEILERHAPGFDRDTMTIRESSNGTFLSMTVIITATGPEQLEALHQDLRATGIVQMVL